MFQSEQTRNSINSAKPLIINYCNRHWNRLSILPLCFSKLFPRFEHLLPLPPSSISRRRVLFCRISTSSNRTCMVIDIAHTKVSLCTFFSICLAYFFKARKLKAHLFKLGLLKTRYYQKLLLANHVYFILFS